MAKGITTKDLAGLIATGQATEHDFEGLEYGQVYEAKLTAGFHVRADACDITEARAEGDQGGDRKISYIASTEDVDRMGDIIRVFGRAGGKGWQLANHKANPVGLWCHDSKAPPIAMVTAWKDKAVEQKGETKPALMCTFDYATEDENPVGEVAFKLAKSKKLRAVSVGFDPIKTSGSAITPEERQEMGLGPWGVEYIEQDLLEVSNCAVPANPCALQTGLKMLLKSGDITQADADLFARVYPLTEEELLKRVRERVRSVVDFGRAKSDPPVEKKIAKGDRVRVKAGSEHMPGHGSMEGTVDQISTPAMAIKFEGMAEPHKWYVASELEAVAEDGKARPAPQPTSTITVRVTGAQSLKDAVATLLARGDEFRVALGAIAVEGTCKGEIALAYQPAPDPAAESTPERTLKDDAAALAENLPAEARTAVSRALSAAFEQLSAAQEALSVVIDAVEADAVEDADVAAMLGLTEQVDGKAAADLIRQLRELIGEHKATPNGGAGGAKAPMSPSPMSVQGSVDPQEASRVILDVRQHLQAASAAG